VSAVLKKKSGYSLRFYYLIQVSVFSLHLDVGFIHSAAGRWSVSDKFIACPVRRICLGPPIHRRASLPSNPHSNIIWQIAVRRWYRTHNRLVKWRKWNGWQVHGSGVSSEGPVDTNAILPGNHHQFLQHNRSFCSRYFLTKMKFNKRLVNYEDLDHLTLHHYWPKFFTKLSQLIQPSGRQQNDSRISPYHWWQWLRRQI